MTATTAPNADQAATKQPAADAVCAAAVDLAREALVEVEGADAVGEYVGVEAGGERVATHLFASTAMGYRGWRWAVTVVRASRSRVATVAEVVLLPGAQAVLAPKWLPWDERLRPGDLGVGDLLPSREDDLRLAPGFSADDDDLSAVDPLSPPWWELGLGRVRVLSGLGRDEAADRWYDGDSGPSAAIALAAPAQCSSCGFLVPLSGALRQAFGVCAHEMSPSDGRVVAMDHGCGAHSEAALVPSSQVPVADGLLDEVGFDVIAVHGQVGGSIEDSAPAEELGHS